MKSKVTYLYDYKQAPIPESLRRWRVRDEEIDEQLSLLSQTYARGKEVGSVQLKDTVICRGESIIPRWNRPVLLFYPGFHLCEETLENGLIGMHPGETKILTASDGEVALTICRILRGREPFPIGNELIRQQMIDDVETLEEYRRWYREKTEAQRRSERSIPISVYLQQELISCSKVWVDEEEEAHWTWDWINHRIAAATANGMDWKIWEGLDSSLEDAEAKRQLFASYKDGFRTCLIFRALLVQAGFEPDSIFRSGLEEMASAERKTTEELIAEAGHSAVEMSALMKPAKHIIYDYTVTHLDEMLED